MSELEAVAKQGRSPRVSKGVLVMTTPSLTVGLLHRCACLNLLITN